LHPREVAQRLSDVGALDDSATTANEFVVLLVDNILALDAAQLACRPVSQITTGPA